ncbi:MAG: autotransporter-associated beta strand repeat-containing protein [Tepidisphaeraceae bacterium]
MAASTIPAAAPATGATWTNVAGGSWTTASNWSPSGGAPNGEGASAVFNANATSDRTITGATGTLGSITFNTTSVSLNNRSHTINGGLTLDGAGTSPATITVAGSGTRLATMSGPLVLASSLTADVSQTASTSLAGALSLNGAVSGPGGLTKDGAGMMTLGGGAKSYMGPTVVSAGRLRIEPAAAPTASSSFTVASGAQVTFQNNGTYALGAGPLRLNGFGLGPSAPLGQLAGALNVSQVVSIGNHVVLESDAAINVTGTGKSLTLTGGISGAGGLTFNASPVDPTPLLGTLVLTGAGSFSGSTVVNAGTLTAASTSGGAGGAGGALGATSSITINRQHELNDNQPATLQLGASDQINDAAPMTLNGGMLATGGFSEGSAGAPGIGALGITEASIIDMGDAASVLAFAASNGTWAGPLDVYNWTGTLNAGGGADQLYFGTNGSGLSPSQLAQLTFYSDAGITPVGHVATQLLTGEVVAALPEPTAASMLALGAVMLLRRRRRYDRGTPRRSIL